MGRPIASVFCETIFCNLLSLPCLLALLVHLGWAAVRGVAGIPGPLRARLVQPCSRSLIDVRTMMNTSWLRHSVAVKAELDFQTSRWTWPVLFFICMR
ncbi:uncharacterized protein CLUP02_09509 [Colletotrichum lupini]|uniref:Uncharacterized protein n=3 Tax=Colletotrichum acutatum species complex TaxID=2707335 RepID=A0A9Q8SV39_9PEZI|nr:uncharacterized protein CLUP02_09509 [Colletotrichum lupini]XP_060312538.1 uncharacterized protein CCOS01_08103 [Colletotrichum costaricense]KAK1470023.1 hypothetical protein CMEL01_01790 [Colletotrichum melonis]KAK1525685.1 hypothetical protein CCOS01_08103 [Colletotrichum costaricense]KAK1708585.1 hypothetical protein BDP67DRAFT_143517 [Colletotrichum lupini]UQC84013.1 hypothetical protein CLUP02_09509 [Colletotrichum lupini]